MKGRRADWQTPLSGFRDIIFCNLVDDGEALTIVIEADDREVSFKWTSFCAYRNTLEEHRLPWDLHTSTPSGSGCTNVVEESSWIAELREKNDLLDLFQPGVRHYVIGNHKYTTEIISNTEPEISVRAR